MKVLWTEEALHDLDEIADYLITHFPAVAPLLAKRINDTVARIRRWPQSARTSAGRPNVRVVPLGRFPYKIFYRVREDAIEVLHVHHGARQPWDEQA